MKDKIIDAHFEVVNGPRPRSELSQWFKGVIYALAAGLILATMLYKAGAFPEMRPIAVQAGAGVQAASPEPPAR